MNVVIGRARAPEVHVMTFNIRRRMRELTGRGRDAWSRRKWLLRRVLEAESPTVLGVQEALPD